MRALPTRVLGADLLTVDTLNGKALHVDGEPASGSDVMRPTLSSSFARNSTKAACTSLSDVRPMMLLFVDEVMRRCNRRCQQSSRAEASSIDNSGSISVHVSPNLDADRCVFVG